MNIYDYTYTYSIFRCSENGNIQKQVLFGSPWKFNSSPLKIGPIGKDRLPTSIFRGCVVYLKLFVDTVDGRNPRHPPGMYKTCK